MKDTKLTTRCFIFALALGVLPGSVLHSLEFPGPDVPALLRVNSVTGISFGQFSQEDHRQSLISRGGGVITMLASRGPSGSHFFVRAFRGLGTEEELASLGQALVDAKVGVQGDCTWGGSDPGQMEITWYGRNGRQNTFLVRFQVEEPPITCPSEVGRLVSKIERFVSDAVSHLPQDGPR